jgi:hypothetical protein
MFGNENCRSDFDKFEGWYNTLMDTLRQQQEQRQKQTTDHRFLLMLIDLLNSETINETNERINGFSQTVSRDLTINIWRLTVYEHNVEIYYNHLYMCCGQNCSICFFTQRPSPLIILDDFAHENKKVMKTSFESAPMHSRHVNLTIIVLAQSVTQIPPSFRLNANINIFTSTATLSQFMCLADKFLSPNQKVDVLNNFIKAKKKEPWSVLFWSDIPYIEEIIFVKIEKVDRLFVFLQNK